jgi:predicted phosphoribosyltransferase
VYSTRDPEYCVSARIVEGAQHLDLLRRMTGMQIFANRTEAGRALAHALEARVWANAVVVLGLPRGGIPVAAEVARALGAPLDVLVVRKIGAPGQPELAAGALASGDVIVMNDDVMAVFADSRREIEATIATERAELTRRERLYRGTRAPVEVAARSVILVDDGMATGSTMRAAIRALRKRNADEIVVAVPTAPAEACAAVRAEADEVVCLTTPSPFFAVGRWYEDFDQTSDTEVRRLLDAASP